MDPKARRPYMPGYGVVGPSERTGLLPWEWATARLIRSHDYWLATVWPDGRPHVTPVWGVWRDDALWFSCSRWSRKARNLEQNPAVVATTDEPRAPVIVEGRATTVDDHAEISTFAGLADTKYQTNYGMEGTVALSHPETPAPQDLRPSSANGTQIEPTGLRW